MLLTHKLEEMEKSTTILEINLEKKEDESFVTL